MLPLFTRPLAVAAGLLLALATARAAPLSSAFTYQGRIDGNGVPVAGPVDLEFAPFADLAGTQSLGAPVVVEDVAVAGGQFTARVDFGPGFFVGDQVFLRIGVRPGAEMGAFELLAPLQELTGTPYALKPAPDSVTDLEIAADAVGTGELADGGVGMADLAPDAVGAAQIADAAVGSDQIKDEAVTAAKLAPDAFTGFMLADGSVTNVKLADEAVDSDKIEDGSIGPGDLDIAAFDPVFWRLGGNPGAGNTFLGTTDGAPLNLRSNVGVTINGPRFNSNTELVIRGSPATVETNADLTLWPRGGTAFFDLAVIGSTPADTNFQILSVGTSPFTGFISRLLLTGSGMLGVGGADPLPLARVHATNADIGLDATDLNESYELILEDVDAQLALFSNPSGGAGSVISLAELDGSGAFANTWGILRNTSGVAGSPLQFTYGTNSSAAGNPYRMFLTNTGGLFVGAVPSTITGTSFSFVDGSSASPFNGSGANQFLVRAAGGAAFNRLPFNANTELTVYGSATAGDEEVDLTLWPRDSGAFFNLNSSGTDLADARLTVQSVDVNPFSGYVPRLVLTGTGGVAFGDAASVGHAGAFVFADESSATTFASSGTNQFLVRATSGAAFNGTPFSTSTEVTVNSDSATAGSQANLMLRPGGNTRGYSIASGGETAANTTFFVYYHDPGGPEALSPYLVIRPNGFASLNPSIGGGGYILPTFPFTVGTPGDTTNGNGAHVTAGGTFVNGSSRTFKQQFTAIDAEAVLDRLLDLPITRWRYRGDDPGWHLGPVAEDFRAAFGLGDDEKYIGTVDADGVALAAVQGLNARLERRAQSLEDENVALREALLALGARVQALEAAGGR
jgi:hypothetical protein